MHQSIRLGPDQEYPEWQFGEVLLMFDASIHGYKRVVLTVHALKEIPILDTGPTATNDRVDLVALKAPGKV
jgi:hypothetical protein